jgi:hypothetical protein
LRRFSDCFFLLPHRPRRINSAFPHRFFLANPAFQYRRVSVNLRSPRRLFTTSRSRRPRRVFPLLNRRGEVPYS